MADTAKPAVQRKRRRGRPPLKDQPKRSSFNTRIRMVLKEQLEAAAREAGRSLSEEIEFRLEQSLLEEEAQYRDFGGQGRFTLMKWFALTIKLAERITGKAWEKDRETFRIGNSAMQTMLEKGLPEVGGLSDEAADAIGKDLGDRLFALAKKLPKA